MHDFEVLKAPFIRGVGQPILVLVTNAAGSSLVTIEWYLFVRLRRDELAFFRHGAVRVDTAPNTDDVRNPHALTGGDGRGTAVGHAKNAFAEYQSSLAKTASEANIVEVQFEVGEPAEIHRLLIAGAGREQIAEMKELTKCQNLKAFLLDALARNPERKRSTDNPYSDEQK